ncbi:nitrilotriacetate monooxygenase [Verrucomicrobia bacterium LW23]|nr:nitrilotriacetate monooxygenase [Verrucomicrobia bacterium LW23]
MSISHTPRQLHFNTFLYLTGHHDSAWRIEGNHPERRIDIDYMVDIARISERGLFDAIFAADIEGGPSKWLEPFTLLAYLAVKTRHIGLIATVNTTYNEPFHLARRLASLDHISKGRAGWNIVTSGAEGAVNYSNKRVAPHDERYDIADEYLDVVTQLWDSWEEGAVINDKAAGIRYDESKIHEINHTGKYYTVRGPLNVSRPPQGRPVLVQSGSSDRGKDYAAKWAEAIFTAQHEINEAREFYNDVNARLDKFDRPPGSLKILPGLCFILGRTEAEANERHEELASHLDLAAFTANLSRRFSVDLSDYPLDKPLVLENPKQADQVDQVRSRHQLVLDLIRREKLSIRRLAERHALGRGHASFVGSATQLADLIEEWFVKGAADGFNLMPGVFPQDLQLFVDYVVPELQRRGLFRTSYEARSDGRNITLRERLGLRAPKPVRSFARAHAHGPGQSASAPSALSSPSISSSVPREAAPSVLATTHTT